MQTNCVAYNAYASQKAKGGKKKKKTLPLQDAWQLTLAMSAIF